MNVQVIRASELRTVAGGSGIQGREGVLYTVPKDGSTLARTFVWDGEKHVEIASQAMQALVSAAGNMGWPALTDLSRERTGRRHIVPFGRLTEWTTVGAANATATEVASESPTVVGPYALRLTADAVSGQAAFGTKDMAFSLNSAAGFWLLLNHRLRHLQGINLTLYSLDQVMEGRGLDQLVDALIADDEAGRLAELAA